MPSGARSRRRAAPARRSRSGWRASSRSTPSARSPPMPGDNRQQRLSRELAFLAFTRDSRGIQRWVLDRLATLFDERRVRAGETLYSVGEPADILYFMSQGSVRM